MKVLCMHMEHASMLRQVHYNTDITLAYAELQAQLGMRVKSFLRSFLDICTILHMYISCLFQEMYFIFSKIPMNILFSIFFF